METLVQEIIEEFYGKPVDPAFVEVEVGARMSAHEAGTLDGPHHRLYEALVIAGQIHEDVADRTNRTNLSELCKRICAAQAKSAAAEAAYEHDPVTAPPPEKQP